MVILDCMLSEKYLDYQNIGPLKYRLSIIDYRTVFHKVLSQFKRSKSETYLLFIEGILTDVVADVKDCLVLFLVNLAVFYHFAWRVLARLKLYNVGNLLNPVVGKNLHKSMRKITKF
jgi:hypothetical protein